CYYDLQTNLAETLGNNLLNGERIPTKGELDDYEDVMNKLNNGFPEESRLDSTGGRPSKLGLAVTLAILAGTITGNSNFKDVVYEGTTNSTYNNTSIIWILDNVTINNTNESIIEIRSRDT
ncbi:MAG: hypothetical protein K8E24_012490, partial [Methanobacterium paludis]|nr:hypothetical protein [Methanobacterium paludis]